MKTHLDLFSGIGGFALAAGWAGYTTVAFVEIDKFCQRVLAKNFPGVPIYGDVKQFNPKLYRGVHLATGGFPCTQTSKAAAIKQSRKGLDGKDSSLWWEYLRIVRECRPIWVVVENPLGILTWADTITTSLEGLGYRVSIIKRTAWSVGLPHLRWRVFFVANSSGKRCEEVSISGKESNPTPLCKGAEAPGGTWSVGRTGIYRMDYGIPNRVDRIRSLGNAVVPQVAYEIIRCME